MTVEWKKGNHFKCFIFPANDFQTQASLWDLWISFTSTGVIDESLEVGQCEIQKRNSTRYSWIRYGSYDTTTFTSQLSHSYRNVKLNVEFIRNISSLEFSISLLAQSSRPATSSLYCCFSSKYLKPALSVVTSRGRPLWKTACQPHVVSQWVSGVLAHHVQFAGNDVNAPPEAPLTSGRCHGDVTAYSREAQANDLTIQHAMTQKQHVHVVV